MSLSKKLFTGFAAFIAAGTFAVAGSAQTTDDKSVHKTEKHERRGMGRGEGFGKRGGGHRGMGGLRGIELTDEQKTAIKAIHEANRPDEAIREELKTIMLARRSGTITPEQTERAKQLRSQSKEKAQSVKLQIDNVLTPEQRQQIETKKAEMKQRREQMREQRQLRKQGAPKTVTEKPID